MQFIQTGIVAIGVLALLSAAQPRIPGNAVNCRTAFVFKPDVYAVANTIKICSDTGHVPLGYQTELNLPVCDDKLCANVWLKVYWDLAGNYSGFDTLPGKPLTKFDHKPFSAADYRKLDQVLNDRNSMLRILSRDELVDKSIKLRATTVDAVTGATPATVKNAVVEGAVYSSYALWHLVNGSLKDSMRHYTLKMISEPVIKRMLESENFETQLFALKQLLAPDFDPHADLIIRLLKRSNPLVRAYAIGKMSLPFANPEKNRELAQLYPGFDNYSKSIFNQRIVSSKSMAEVFVPLLRSLQGFSDSVQQQKLQEAAKKFNLQE